MQSNITLKSLNAMAEVGTYGDGLPAYFRLISCNYLLSHFLGYLQLSQHFRSLWNSDLSPNRQIMVSPWISIAKFKCFKAGRLENPSRLGPRGLGLGTSVYQCSSDYFCTYNSISTIVYIREFAHRRQTSICFNETAWKYFFSLP